MPHSWSVAAVVDAGHSRVAGAGPSRGVLASVWAVLATLTWPAAALTPVEAQKLLASDGEGRAPIGEVVAVDGDTTVIGACRDAKRRGSAYVFTRRGGAWAQQAKLTASDGERDDHFGISVAVSGDTAVIGASGDDESRGSAYVFSLAQEADGDGAREVRPPIQPGPD